MTADELRERARHYREIAEDITDERARRAALFLAADCDQQADSMDGDDVATNARRQLDRSQVRRPAAPTATSWGVTRL